MASAKPLLWVLPGFAIIAMTLAVASYRGQALTALQRLFLHSWLAAVVALSIVKVAIADRGIMGIKGRRERALLRCLVLFSVVHSVALCFIAFDFVAGMLPLGAGASRAWAVLVVAVHLVLGWVAIFGV